MSDSRTGKKQAKLKKNLNVWLENENFYEALQVTKTLYYRYVADNNLNEAHDLLLSVAGHFTQKNQINAAVELGHLLLDLFRSTTFYSFHQALRDLKDLTQRFPQNKREVSKISFMKEILKWIRELKQQNKISGEETQKAQLDFHQTFARQLSAEGSYAAASKFFLRSQLPYEFAEMLFQWSLEGYPSEFDLFLARGVLSLLALGKSSDGNDVLVRYEELYDEREQRSHQRTPLQNFLHFSIIAVTRSDFEAFKYLKQKYQPSIMRDPEFSGMLKEIASQYFQSQQPINPLAGLLSGSGGGVGQMISEMMKGILLTEANETIDPSDIDMSPD